MQNNRKRLSLLQNASSEGEKLIVAITYLLYDTVTAIGSEVDTIDNSLTEVYFWFNSVFDDELNSR